MADACGLAGGTPWLAEVGEAGDYTKTIYAHHGMNGTLLKPMDTGVVWTIGLEAEVTWQVENNHGGGYSYVGKLFALCAAVTCYSTNSMLSYQMYVSCNAERKPPLNIILYFISIAYAHVPVWCRTAVQSCAFLCVAMHTLFVNGCIPLTMVV